MTSGSPGDTYAHSLADRPPSAGWEPLADHLALVATLAGASGNAAGIGWFAQMAGQLHDIGKVSAAYQDYIAGRAGGRGPDHSTAGARVATDRWPGGPGKLIAYAIAGHHAGLADGSGFEATRSTLAERLDPARTIADHSGWEAHAGPLSPMPRLMPPTANPIAAGFHRAFLARMIFSCLVDADFIATEAFYAGADGRSPPARGGALTPALGDRLAAYMAGREAGATGLNRLRADIRAHALSKAALPPGLFTLTVPTGGGKTLTSLSFALAHARRHGLRRIVYVIPFTSIIEQTAQVFREALGLADGSDVLLEHHSAFDWDGRPPGDDDDPEHEGRAGLAKLRRAAENWDAPIVVTTAVQFFESLFADRPSRARKLHNLARSVIVVDEAQTLPVPLLWPSMAALQELASNYGASVVLCTATQPALRVQDGALPNPIGGFDLPADRELAPDPPGLYTALRRTRVEWRRQPVSDAEIAARFADQPQMLCIVGSRAHARDLFTAIAALPGARHLTTLMHAAHRSRVLAEVKDDLRNGRPVRSVATSLIEAGVDVDFPEVWRAAAGLDAIAQAAGRCNREGRLGQDAPVVVFEPAEAKPPRSLAPFYDAARQVLRDDGGDPLGLDAVRRYFRHLYAVNGADALDRHGIVAAIAAGARNLDFPFERIARDYRLIDETMVPVLIALDDPARDAIARLKQAPVPPGDVLRRLQRYAVPVPPNARRALLAAGDAEAIRPEDCGDRFVVLVDTDRYDARLGLRLDDPVWREAERNVV